MSVRSLGVLLLLALAAAAGAGAWIRCEGEAPRVEAPERVAVGRDGRRVPLAVTDPGSGVRRLTVRVRQGDEGRTLVAESFPGSALAGAPRPREPRALTVEIEPEALGLEAGEATLEVEAVDWSWAELFSGNAARAEIALDVDLEPPRVRVRSGLTYVHRGGSAAVAYRLDEEAGREGVEVGETFFAGYPHPAGEGRVALFAVPRDAGEDPDVRVVAVDEAGNRGEASWPTRVRDRGFEEVTLDLGGRFLEEKVARLARELGMEAEDPLEAFREINERVRAENERRVREIAAESAPEPLWEGAFVQLPGSAVTSRFAERRLYRVDGEVVSEAVHYGYDLAKTAAAPVPASNAGRVLFAERLGIYGNCVILDHGLGLATLYGHLSRADVSRGDRVAKGERLGLTGETGLAGGDHLHFAVLVGGTYVDPKEWWDPRWVRTHVTARLEAGGGAEEP